MSNAALSILYRIITRRPLNGLTLLLMDDAVSRYGGLLSRDIFEGIDSFFVRDMIGNVDTDGDGRDDAFRLAVTNAWFDQRITGVELGVDGRRVDPGRLLLRMKGRELKASDLTAPLDFPPGEAFEVTAGGFVLSDGLHMLDMTVGMELVSQVIPALPVLVRSGVGDIAVSPDRLRPLPAWPPRDIAHGTVHVVPHIHYDVEWQHTRDVFEQLGAGNLLEMLRLMEEDPEMTFVLDQVAQLEPFRRRYPEPFERIASLVRDGRIEAVNGMYSEPDVNLVSGESLVRQSVAWQEFAAEHFGGPSKCGWLIDSFGMSAQLPQILKLSGCESVAFSRAALPQGAASEFVWRGPDGSELLATDMPGKYNIAYPVPTDPDRSLKKALKNYLFLRERSATDQVFYPGGVDHGRPQKEYGDMVRLWNERVDGVTMRFSTPTRFFESLDRERLEVREGEFMRELWGTYSSRASIKRADRECEFTLLDAGKMATVASIFGAAYPAERLERSWRDVMDCQFHDQICGCCTDPVAAGMKERFARAKATGERLMEESARFLAGAGESGGVLRLLAFNPLSVAADPCWEFEADLPPGFDALAAASPEGPVPLQLTDVSRYGDGSMKRVKAVVRATVPPLGIDVFDLLPGPGETPAVEDPARADGTTLSNGLVEVGIDERTGLLCRASSGGIRFDLSGSNRLTLERDFGNLYDPLCLGTTWAHRRKVDSVRVVEGGPLRATVEVAGSVGRSRFTQRISITSGCPRIDMDTVVEFADPGCRLRCRFPTGLGGGRWSHEVPYAVIERPGHELPAQNFTDLSGPDSGVTLINSGIPGNKCHRGTVYLTLMRSVDKIYLWDAGPDALELGRQRFRYSLYPHAGDWRRAGSVVEAYRRSDPPRAFVTGAGGEPRARGYSALAVSGDAMVTAMERGPGGGVTVRLWETTGKGSGIAVEPSWDFEKVEKTDLLGRTLEEHPPGGKAVRLALRPFEIANLVFR